MDFETECYFEYNFSSINLDLCWSEQERADEAEYRLEDAESWTRLLDEGYFMAALALHEGVWFHCYSLSEKALRAELAT